MSIQNQKKVKILAKKVKSWLFFNLWNVFICKWLIQSASMLKPWWYAMETSPKSKIQNTIELITIGFSKWEKRQKIRFWRDFKILISNISVELVVTHKTIYIFWKNSLSSTQKSKIWSSENILSKSKGLSKWQNFEHYKFGQSLEAWNPESEKKIGSKFWFFERIRLCLSENYYGNLKQGCSSSEMHYK